MQNKHVPVIGPRYWTALCMASVFGANTGDFLAKVLGLGHVRGLPVLALVLAVIFVIERRDRHVHQAWYWLAIVVIRTAATNLADFFAGDMKLEKGWVMLGLAILLAAIVLLARFSPSRPGSAPGSENRTGLPTTNAWFWTSMLLAGTLGTVAGDFSSFASGLGLQRSTITLCVLLGAWFYFGRGLLRVTPYYWFSIVLVRAAGTAVGDFLASRSLGLGLPMSTLSTGVLFLVVLLLWRPRRELQPRAS
jgi:uncharacterized membrane-anchored protein